jgi:NAD(P)-dependent dehydrogenase (short-subunit alcohol dehydrogenase family)
MMKVLIAGGAGYIGSTVASACLDAGISPVILDSLVTGRREFITGRAFYQGDIADGPLVDRIFVEHPDIGAVIHCPALIVVAASVADPVGYYRANVTESLEFVAPAAQRLPPADLQLLGRDLPGRGGPDCRRGFRHRSAEPVRANQGGVRRNVCGDRRRQTAARTVASVLQPDRHGP